jgi:predicted glutamine amidotransferase
MCRMVGMAAQKQPAGEIGKSGAAESVAPLPSWWHLVGAPNSLRIQANTGNVPPGEEGGHDDSWGVAWFDEAGQASLIRQTDSAADSAYYVFASEAAARAAAGSGPGQVVIGHLRKASCGDITSENAHPIKVEYRDSTGLETLMVAHNGTVRKPLLATLRTDLQAAGRSEAGADSDTVVLAGWLAVQIGEQGGELFPALTEALRELLRRATTVAPEGDETKSYTSVNLLIGHRSGLFALRQFSALPDYYTLYVRPVAPEEGQSGGWLVASEKTDEAAGWELLPPGMLTFFPTTEDAFHTASVV